MIGVLEWSSGGRFQVRYITDGVHVMQSQGRIRLLDVGITNLALTHSFEQGCSIVLWAVGLEGLNVVSGGASAFTSNSKGENKRVVY